MFTRPAAVKDCNAQFFFHGLNISMANTILGGNESDGQQWPSKNVLARPNQELRLLLPLNDVSRI